MPADQTSTQATDAVLHMAGSKGGNNNGEGGVLLHSNLQSPNSSRSSLLDMSQLFAQMSLVVQQNSAALQSVTQSQSNVNVQYTVFPDLSHNIVDFDGLSGSANAKVWLKQLESTAVLHSWTEPIAFEKARSHLTRAAKNWYIGNLHRIVDWRSFRQAFANTFLQEKAMTAKWEELQKRCQKPGEDTREYFFDKVRLCKALNFEMSEIVTQVAVGLRSKSTSSAIRSQTHFDVGDLLSNIVRHEGLE